MNLERGPTLVRTESLVTTLQNHLSQLYRITCHNSVPSQYVQVVHTKMRQVLHKGVVRTKVAPFFHMRVRSIMLFRSWSDAYRLGAWPDFNTYKLYALR